MRAPSSASHVRTASLSSHSPVTLWRKRTRPSTPPSFVKLASRAASLTTGSSSSTPTSPHVPHEMYAAFGVLSGTATIAEAVSCEPTAMTSSGAPTALAGLTVQRAERRAGIDERRAERMPGSRVAPASSRSHSPVRTSTRPVVEALVRSATRAPVRRNATRSGMSSATSASDSRCFDGVLVERVERQELQAVAAVELLERHRRVHRLDAARGALVAVVERLGEQLARRATRP